MRRASTFNRSVNSSHNPIAAFEPLEQRRLLSGTTALGTVLSERVDVPFTAELGTFVTLAPGNNLSSNISWGDGTESTGTIKPTGVVGIDEIQFELDGSHTYDSAGRFGIQAAVYQTLSSTLIRLVASFDDLAVVAKTNVFLNGTITGDYGLTPASPGGPVGAGYAFNGTGTAGQLGPVSAHGLVSLPGPPTGPTPVTATAAPLATGSLTLTSASASASPVANSVTLEVTGVSEMGMFPSILHFVVTSGTGAFAGATGVGTIGVTLGSAGDAQSFKFVINSFLPPTVPFPTSTPVSTPSDPITVELQPVVDSLATLEEV